MNLSENFIKRMKKLADILQEADSTLENKKILYKEEKNNDTYFDTLSQALQKVEERAKKDGFEIVDQEREFFLFGTGGIKYGETKRGRFDLEKEGKISRKKLHVQLYRMDSGRYELNQYIN